MVSLFVSDTSMQETLLQGPIQPVDSIGHALCQGRQGASDLDRDIDMPSRKGHLYTICTCIYIYTVKDRFFRIVGISYNIFKCLVQISYNI